MFKEVMDSMKEASFDVGSNELNTSSRSSGQSLSVGALIPERYVGLCVRNACDASSKRISTSLTTTEV